MKSAFATALRAVRHSLAPLLLIQAAAVVLVVLYYRAPAFTETMNELQAVKANGGLIFSALSTAVAGAILPQIARFITRRPLVATEEYAFQFMFFAALGITVDLLYRYLAVLFGASPSFETVGKKLLVDQFLYAPLVSVPLSSLAFLWQENGFKFAGIGKRRLVDRYVSLLVTCWCFWIPVLICVYSLPTNLQFMLFLCANAAWSLLLVFISSEASPATE